MVPEDKAKVYNYMHSIAIQYKQACYIAVFSRLGKGDYITHLEILLSWCVTT